MVIKYAPKDNNPVMLKTLEEISISTKGVASIPDPSRALLPSLKELNRYYDALKNAISLLDSSRVNSELEKSFNKIRLYRTMHTMLCNYYKAMRLLEQAKNTNHYREWNASAHFHLPTDLMKMIAYHTVTVT